MVFEKIEFEYDHYVFVYPDHVEYSKFEIDLVQLTLQKHDVKIYSDGAQEIVSEDCPLDKIDKEELSKFVNAEICETYPYDHDIIAYENIAYKSCSEMDSQKFLISETPSVGYDLDIHIQPYSSRTCGYSIVHYCKIEMQNLFEKVSARLRDGSRLKACPTLNPQ